MAGKGVLIVVPARGGSKGLPRKNAMDLGNIPLLGWTAQAVRDSGLDEALCVLSTDDDEIADIGRRIGLGVPFERPPELATDVASAEAVALHALDWARENVPVEIDSVMWLQPTSPFRPPGVIAEAVKLREKRPNVASVIGVKAIHRTARTLFHADSEGVLTPLDGRVNTPNLRQAHAPLYTPNGAVYLASAAALREGRGFFADPCAGLVMDQVASLDIDDELDMKMAEAVAHAGHTWRGRISTSALV